MISSFPLRPRFVVRVESPLDPPDAVKAEVDRIWACEKDARGGKIADSTIYSLAEYKPDLLRIRPSEYRFALARRRAPHLVQEGLDIRPLAVTGILLCTDGLVLGRRGDQVASDPNLWEPATAGSLPQPDPLAQVLEELQEELGLPLSRITSTAACGLVEDVETGVFDIVYKLVTDASGTDVRASFESLESSEYVELAIMAPAEIAGFLQRHRNRVLPALEPMLRLSGLL